MLVIGISRQPDLLKRSLVAVRKTSSTTRITEPWSFYRWRYWWRRWNKERGQSILVFQTAEFNIKTSIYSRSKKSSEVMKHLKLLCLLLSSACLGFIWKFNENIFYLSLNSVVVITFEEPPFTSLSPVSKRHHLWSAAFNAKNSIQSWSCACTSFQTCNIIAKLCTHVPRFLFCPLSRLSVAVFIPKLPTTDFGMLKLCWDAFTAFKVFKPLLIMITWNNSETSQMIMNGTGCCTLLLWGTCWLVPESLPEIDCAKESVRAMT